MDVSHPAAATADLDDIVLDAWDKKGRPAIRSLTGGWTAAAMILVVELCERLTTLGIGANLVTYLTGTMHIGEASAVNIVANFFGTSFILALFGGFIADTFLGRYITIATFSTIQAIGVTVLSISTAVPNLQPPKCQSTAGVKCERATSFQMAMLYLALYVTALGTGGIKSSVSGFGSDQFDESDKVEKKKMTRFFGWFFFFISFGSLTAVTVLVYVQDNVGRSYGYGIIALAILGGLSIFIGGTRRYRIKKLVGSPLTQVASVVIAAVRKRKLPMPTDSSSFYDVDSSAATIESGGRKMKRRLPRTNQFLFLNRAAIIEEPSAALAGTKSRWLLTTLTEVEEVKMVVRMLPIWATTIMFWAVHAQMVTYSVSQSDKMNRRLGSSFQIPAASLNAFFIVSILVTVPVYDLVTSRGLTQLRRIAIGLALSVVSMMAAALVENKRLHSPGYGDSMTVFWLVPQFFLVGAGEAFVYGGQLDFFLRQCPAGMKTMSSGLLVSTMSLGFFMSSVLVTIVGKVTGDSGDSGGWLTDDLNNGRLDKFYWLISVLSGVNLLLFMAAARWYKYRNFEAEQLVVELEG